MLSSLGFGISFFYVAGGVRVIPEDEYALNPSHAVAIARTAVALEKKEHLRHDDKVATSMLFPSFYGS